jgi:cytoskeletal protein CcmA (bactofilin family)
MLFKSKNEPDFVEQVQEVATIIAEGTLFAGTVESQGNMRIDGTVNGDVQGSNKVIIGPKGQVKGNITAQQIIVLGELVGDALAKESLVLKAGAHMEGNICTTILTIEPDAMFNGRCQMDKQVIEMETGKKNVQLRTTDKAVAAGK